jgi:hypothetical protein
MEPADEWSGIERLSLIWAVWHYPFAILFTFSSATDVPAAGLALTVGLGLAGNTISSISMTYLYAWIYIHTESVFLAILLHALYNVVPLVLGVGLHPLLGLAQAAVPWGLVFVLVKVYGLIQCKDACHDGLYDDEELVRSLQASTVDCRVPSSLVPVCPVCGGEMAPHLRGDKDFVEDARWREMRAAYLRLVNDGEGAQPCSWKLAWGTIPLASYAFRSSG